MGNSIPNGHLYLVITLCCSFNGLFRNFHKGGRGGGGGQARGMYIAEFIKMDGTVNRSDDEWQGKAIDYSWRNCTFTFGPYPLYAFP